LAKLLTKHQHVFSKSKGDLGHTDLVQDTIRNESGRFVALKSDSTHHFFRNACTKSGSLRFSQFGISTDPDKVKAVQDWPRPKTPKQIKVITKLPNSEQSYKWKVQTHNYINSLTKW
jgi:hypothetical protein